MFFLFICFYIYLFFCFLLYCIRCLSFDTSHCKESYISDQGEGFEKVKDFGYEDQLNQKDQTVQ